MDEVRSLEIIGKILDDRKVKVNYMSLGLDETELVGLSYFILHTIAERKRGKKINLSKRDLNYLEWIGRMYLELCKTVSKQLKTKHGVDVTVSKEDLEKIGRAYLATLDIADEMQKNAVKKY